MLINCVLNDELIIECLNGMQKYFENDISLLFFNLTFNSYIHSHTICFLLKNVHLKTALKFYDV